jgi:calcineurin-like phosphoesterase family protein
MSTRKVADRSLAPRPLAKRQVNKRHAFHSNQKFEPLPPPTGAAPYHLALETILTPSEYASIQAAQLLVFHVAGDTGGVKAPQSQQIVAMKMSDDVAVGGPAFFYHLGDVVYFNGETKEYYPQFYEPYAEYHAPIVAIPGNHDGDPIGALEPSLAAFVHNFCSARPHVRPEAQENQRKTMTQPNVYWTLETPVATIVGLYTNVPEGGRVDDEQRDWFVSELETAPKDRALIVALHHPIYSADAHHGGSERMGELLDGAMESAKRVPDLVLTGHVHNYQRFTRKTQGHHLPYVVAGAGGYWHLHYMAKGDDGGPLPTPWKVPDQDVTLENYADDRHGYLRLSVSASTIKGEYITVPRPQESWQHGPLTTLDTFAVDLKKHSVT